MGRKKKAYRMRKRDQYFYYMLPHQTVFHSTGETKKTDADKYVLDLLQKHTIANEKTLRNFCKNFYIYDKCSYVKRLLEQGRIIGEQHCKNRRSLLEKYVFTDPIADLKIADINRGCILDFQGKLVNNNNISKNTVNKVIATLNTVFGEAFYREVIIKNPVSRVGELKYKSKEIGTFNEKELQMIFPENGIGPWNSNLDYTLFLLAATSGMRRGEILALKWKNINFEESYLDIKEAWKNKNKIGKPKWEHERSTPLPKIMVEKLLVLRDESLNCLEDDLVFCNSNGQRLTDNHWRRGFADAMKNTKFSEERNLTPKSFRHSFNTILKALGYSNEKIRASQGWTPTSLSRSSKPWRRPGRSL